MCPFNQYLGLVVIVYLDDGVIHIQSWSLLEFQSLEVLISINLYMIEFKVTRHLCFKNSSTHM